MSDLWVVKRRYSGFGAAIVDRFALRELVWDDINSTHDLFLDGRKTSPCGRFYPLPGSAGD